MISNERFDRELGAALSDLAPARTPDYLNDILGLTARTRQRPAWASLERWIPVDVTSRLVGAPTIPWRRFGLLAAAALLLALMAAIYAGSRPFEAAPPYGLATNGLVAYEAKGDIFVAHPQTGTITTITSGAAAERQPAFSLDGTRLAYVSTSSDGAHVVVARPDGSGQTVVTPDPLATVERLAFSPNGRQLAISSQRDGVASIALVSVDGADFTWLETDGPASFPTFRPPDGAELLFARGYASHSGQGIYAMDLASGRISEIAPPRTGGELTGAPQYSPDGERIAYTYWISGIPEAGAIARGEEVLSRVYIVDADGLLEPNPIPVPDTICCDGYLAWSNDGTRLAFSRWYDSPAKLGLVVVPWETGGEGTFYEIPGMYTARIIWSPDDRYILVTLLDTDDTRLSQLLLDVEAGTTRTLDGGAKSDPTWQRLAP